MVKLLTTCMLLFVCHSEPYLRLQIFQALLAPILLDCLNCGVPIRMPQVIRVPMTILSLLLTAEKATIKVLSNTQKQHVIAQALSDATDCRKPLGELVVESQLNISTSTLRHVQAAAGIRRHATTTKPYRTLKTFKKKSQIAFC